LFLGVQFFLCLAARGREWQSENACRLPAVGSWGFLLGTGNWLTGN
jgi:hypothetical protein